MTLLLLLSGAEQLAGGRLAASLPSPASAKNLPGLLVRGALDGLPQAAMALALAAISSSSAPNTSSAGTPDSFATLARALSSSALALRSSTRLLQAAASSLAFWISLLDCSWSSS